MELLVPIIAGLAAVAALTGVIVALHVKRRVEQSTNGIFDQIAQLSNDSEKMRNNLESVLRESSAQHAAGQTELTLKLLGQLAENGTRLTGTLNEQFQQFQQTVGLTLQSLETSQKSALAQSRDSSDLRLQQMDKSLRETATSISKTVADLQAALLATQQKQVEHAAEMASNLSSALVTKLEELRREQVQVMTNVSDGVQKRLDLVRQDNEQKLEKIRATVDEKLHATLETKLGESFRLVSERLELVHKGLGEMKSLAEGVGDLKRVLTNVHSRGAFGEVQLGALLEQVLLPSQYERNVATSPNSTERVEFAIRLPGREGNNGHVYLPIDAKFPIEDYVRLAQAYETSDLVAVEQHRKALRIRLVDEANTICKKYVSPPDTTDFALLFLPTEGLYAEALRMEGLIEELQRKCRVVLVGPTTLYAILNSLQMGFRTLAIEKRSSEVWRVLGAVKTEFAKFGEALSTVSRKLQEASNKIEDTNRRSRVLQRKLSQVEELPESETQILLSTGEAEPAGEAITREE